MSERSFLKRQRAIIVTFVASAAATLGVALLLINIGERKGESRAYPLRVVEIPEWEIDPSVWGKNFPPEYDSFVKTEIDYGKTEYGGSTPYDKLERYPAMKRLWAGYPFSIDHKEDRGHHFAAEDQKNTKRVQVANQPAGCASCHAAESVGMIERMGWESWSALKFNDIKDSLKTGSSCADCHDPKTMGLVITRAALVHALERAGIDWKKASRQEMRSYVCAQCHVEYYFLGDRKELTFPWSKGRTIEAIEAHYDEYAFSDWKHGETGGPMLKMQHPEFELWGTGVHARSGVSCADCHMPYMREGAVKVSDHWVRSPLNNLARSCGTCHPLTEAELKDRVLVVQRTTAGLLRRSEEALLASIDAIIAARARGATDGSLAEALRLHRSAQMRWDFVSSENSTGFHSPQEAARILAESIDLARRAQIAAAAPADN